MVAVLVPWRPGDAHREDAWSKLRARHEEAGRTVIEGSCGDGPWCKAAAITDALTRCTDDLLVIHDADVWCDGLDQAIATLDGLTRWAIPHDLVYRLKEDQHEATTDKTRCAQHPYRGFAGGGIVAIDRTAYERCPLDPRFVGWGHEDESWALALGTLYGQPWRGDHPLFHWWHPPQERRSRARGSHESQQLRDRYRAASGNRQEMLDLIAGR